MVRNVFFFLLMSFVRLVLDFKFKFVFVGFEILFKVVSFYFFLIYIVMDVMFLIFFLVYIMEFFFLEFGNFKIRIFCLRGINY